MTETPTAPAGRRRLRLQGGGFAWLALLLVLAVGVIVGAGETSGQLQLANPDPTRSAQVKDAFARLPAQAPVLVAMDPDLGTYAEIRPTLRAAFDDLLRRGASLAFVSVTVEGRAIAVAELERLRDRGTADDVLLDVGFVSGAEAGMVRLVGDALPPGASGPLADAIAAGGGGLGGFQMVLLVGGVDMSPRSWVEQVGTRLPALPMVAVAPTFAQPELAPYLRTGQLAGLLATVRDGAAYTQAVDVDQIVLLSEQPRGDRPPSALAVLLGMSIAIGVLGRQLLGSLPGLGGSSLPAEAPEDEQS
jgi:hypothetical protein